MTARLLFDSISSNTGDKAIGIANAQLLSQRGVGSTIVDPVGAKPPGRLLIGGGELIRPRGSDFYDEFRPQGDHILNASGVWTDADHLDFLHDYAVVSARSSVEARVLESVRSDVRVVPCSTTLLESEHFEIPGVRPHDRLVGIHLVPHSLRLVDDLVRIVDSIPGRKVFLPFTHYNADYSFMENLPFDRSDAIMLGKLDPLQLHSVIGQLSYAVVSSLHASIFAYSQNVPFASLHQKKVEYYFGDRGLSEHVVSTGPELERLIGQLDEREYDFSELIAKDRQDISSAFDEYAQLLGGEDSGEPIETAKNRVSAQSRRAKILDDQGEYVIRDRDLALGLSEGRRRLVVAEVQERGRHVLELDTIVAEQNRAMVEADGRLAELDSKLTALDTRYALLASEHERLENLWWVRAIRRASRVVRAALRRPARPDDH